MNCLAGPTAGAECNVIGICSVKQVITLIAG